MFEFIELMATTNDHSFERISDALTETVASAFGDHILAKLAYIEVDPDSKVQLARLKIINWG